MNPICLNSSDPSIVNEPACTSRRLVCALLIITTIGALIGAGVGLGGFGAQQGWWSAGTLSHLSQTNSTIIMAAGGGGGIVFLIIGIVGSVKNRQTSSRQQNDHNEGIEHNSVVSSKSEKNIGIASTIETHGGLIYGANAWQIWNVEVLDNVPDAPEIHWDDTDPYFNEAFRENYALLYIPERIRVNGVEKKLTLKIFQEISSGSFGCFCQFVEGQFRDSTAPGWVLVSKKVIPECRSKNYDTQKEMVETKGFSMLHILEAAALNLMVEAFTGEKLYGKAPLTYTRCVEKVNGKYPVLVGGFDSAGLQISSFCIGESFEGVACAMREF